jgi:hypothetical protein
MVSELKTFGILFLGMAIGYLNPIKSHLGWIIPMVIATFFIGLDLYFEYKDRKCT